MPSALRAFLCFALACAAVCAQAKVIEEQLTVPVKVATAHGRIVEHQIHVTLVLDDASPQPRPLLVLNHGRSGTAAQRAQTTVTHYASTARWLTGFGFLVAMPVRVGYGVTGGDDVEDSGVCSRKIYPPVYHASAVQTLAVLEALRKRPDAAQDRAVVMGQSFGGTTAVTIAALAPPGIQGGINFAGGGGGRPDTHPMDPCAQPELQKLFSDYGRTARMPTLWIYSENDSYFGPRLPREWFEGFRKAGGAGELMQVPPQGYDGHLFFSRGAVLWRPRVREFLVSIGYPPLTEAAKK